MNVPVVILCFALVCISLQEEQTKVKNKNYRIYRSSECEIRRLSPKLSKISKRLFLISIQFVNLIYVDDFGIRKTLLDGTSYRSGFWYDYLL